MGKSNGDLQPLSNRPRLSTWTITLRTDLHWSDGKPIIREDVIQTISANRLSTLIEEIKTDGKNRLHIRLANAESMFLQRLASLPIRPSHSRQPYRVTSGAYRLKRFRREAINFRLPVTQITIRSRQVALIGLPSNVSSTPHMQSKHFSAKRSISYPSMRCNPCTRFQMTYRCSRHPFLGKPTICCSSTVVKNC